MADGRGPHPRSGEQTQRLAVKRIGARIDRAHLSQAFNQFIALLFDFGATHGLALWIGSPQTLSFRMKSVEICECDLSLRRAAVAGERIHGLEGWPTEAG